MIAASGIVASTVAQAAGPENWRIGFPEPASRIEELIVALHDRVVLIGGLIVLLVAVILFYCAWRFRAARHPQASKVARAPVLEFGWTVLPIIVLGMIVLPSLAVLSYEADIPPADITVKVTGFQWFWRYDYIDSDGVVFDSLIVPEEELEADQPRLLTVDNPLVVPTGAAIHFLVTSGDVIHSFFLPPLGVQMYAIPGRLNQTWVRIDRPGMYYGQCNQICGLNHSFMPIAVDARSPEDFAAWLAEAKARFSGVTPAPPVAIVPAPPATPPATAPAPAGAAP